MTLSSANPQPIVGSREPLLVVVLYNRVERCTVEPWIPAPFDFGDQRFDQRPSAVVEHDAIFPRIVTKDRAEELADFSGHDGLKVWADVSLGGENLADWQ